MQLCCTLLKNFQCTESCLKKCVNGDSVNKHWMDLDFLGEDAECYINCVSYLMLC